MKLSANFFFNVVILLVTACSQNSGDQDSHSPASDYKVLLQELHKIECENLVKQGGSTQDTEVYAFRSKAFQAVLKDLDRTVLVRYEDLFQELARIEHGMSDKEKRTYEEYRQQVYASGCN